jgi:hypothetical protein
MNTALIYIAGKVTGLDRTQTLKKFKTAQDSITDLGLGTLNPMDLVKNPETNWKDAMRICLRGLLLCDCILLLPDAKQSKGALVEYQLAKNLGIRVFQSMDQVKAYANENH